jgi:hypothetical protein
MSESHPKICVSRERTRNERPGSNQQANWDGRVAEREAVPRLDHAILLGGAAKIGIVTP